MTRHRIAVIAGDGIGKEVVPEGIRVLDAAAVRFGFELQWDLFPWSCEYLLGHGAMMPADGLDRIAGHDAIYLGAVGFPGVPDHVSLWGLLIPIRRRFQQYANLRPVRLMPGVKSPLAGRVPGDIDFLVVRENTEGEYSTTGGLRHAGTDREEAFQESVFTRRGVDRILRYAFERPRQVEAVNAGFLPPAADIDWARRVLEAAEQASGNAVRLDGKMIDRPVIERARAIMKSARGAVK